MIRLSRKLPVSESRDWNVVLRGEEGWECGWWSWSGRDQGPASLWSVSFMQKPVAGKQVLTICLGLASPEAFCIHFLGLPHMVPHTRGLKQQQCVLSHFRRLKRWNQGVSRVGSFLRLGGSISSVVLLASGDNPCRSLACRWHHSSLCFCRHLAFFCVSSGLF